MKINSVSLLQQYQQRVGNGEIRADRAQFTAIRQLNSLHRTLLARQQKPTWLTRALKYHRRTCRGLYLWGGVGTGKTMLMDMFYHAVGDDLAQRIHFHRFMLSVHDARKKLAGKQEPLAIIAAQQAARGRVLCLDEFSVTDITDAMLLSGFLHHLFSHGVALVTTSNTHPQSLYQGGMQRQRFLPAIALLSKQTRVVKVDSGKDYRMQRLQLGALYHVPHDERAARALRESFMRLEGGMDAQPKCLLLAGREVELIACGRGTAWFSFAALCATHRSKVDYIELSKRFHTLILADIPRLDAALDDSARRLIELVDELYDMGVNLIASAAATPADLYRGTRLQQPFQRTVSRLQEMSSREYLSRPHQL